MDGRKWPETSQHKEYLSNPFDDQYIDSQEFRTAIGEELIENHLQEIFDNNKTAQNHRDYAIKAKEGLTNIIKTDIESHGSTLKDFELFLAFSHEPIDRFGRFLAWIERQEETPANRDELTYNEKMLKEGLAVPYFIFPNISPFVNESIINSVPCPDEFFSIVNKEGSSLYEARKMVKGADKRGLGVFDKHNPLLLLPFELRFLCDRSTGSNRKLFSCEGVMLY